MKNLKKKIRDGDNFRFLSEIMIGVSRYKYFKKVITKPRL